MDLQLTKLFLFIYQIALYVNKDIIENVPFFREVGEDCVALLVTYLKPVQAVPGIWCNYLESIFVWLSRINDYILVN